MAELTLKEFENINTFSNNNVEKVMNSVVNNSSNAVLINMFEDSVILLDHDEGNFYMADYEFDPENLTIEFYNFEEVELKKEENDFKEKIYEYFEDDESSSYELAENYKNDILSQERYVNELIHDAMLTKDFNEVLDYREVKEAVEELGNELEGEDFYEEYKKRLESHPLTEVKYFNWEDPVKISLVETETQRYVNTSAVERAKTLWKDKDFREEFKEAAETFVEDVEQGTDLFKALFENYPQVFFLDNSERKTLFGKTSLSVDMREEMNELTKGLEILFERFDLGEMRDAYLAEANGEDDDDVDINIDVDDDDEKGEEGDDGKKKKKKEEKAPVELSPAQAKKMADTLKSISGEVEDPKTKEKIDDLISQLEESPNKGTSPKAVKEAVSLLNL